MPAQEKLFFNFYQNRSKKATNRIFVTKKLRSLKENILTMYEKKNLFNDIEKLRYCEQCGVCSSACLLTGINDFNIRRIIRHVELELIDEIADSLMPWFCATCGKCEDACPNGIKILDITRTLRAISFDKKEEFLEDMPPCVKSCPAQIDIPEYIRLISEGKNDEAYGLIMEKALFPAILGRVCAHPCEDACKRSEISESVSICALKRYAADNVGANGCSPKNLPDTGKKIAIIGAGPAGLSASFYLRKLGHYVTIFDAQDKPGGMMRYAIPRYRLPEDILDKEIEGILSIGIEFKPNYRLGDNLTTDILKDYSAVFIGIGAQKSRKINIEGADLDGVLWGLDFLFKAGKEKIDVKKNVAVIGGGNVAIDAALTALRLGAQNVSLICLEAENEMPASHEEIATAREEGVNILTSWGPDKIIGENGKVTGIELIGCDSVFDDKCVFNPSFNNTKKIIETDQVIIAIGQTSDVDFCKNFSFADADSLNIKNNLIISDKKTQSTNIKGVFTGGDVSTGPLTVIEAIASGRRAALAIDKYLGGDGRLSSIFSDNYKDNRLKNYDGKREKGFSELKQAKMHNLPIEKRYGGFNEIKLGLSKDEALYEAKRCLNCDLEFCLAKKMMAS
jgi:NADPH-dependent glutamate synthase beta subunit-like oxidoreductase